MAEKKRIRTAEYKARKNARARERRAEDPELERQYHRDYRAKNKAHLLARQREYRERTREARREYLRKYRADNRELCRSYGRTYKLKHRQRVKEKDAAYRKKNAAAIRDRRLANINRSRERDRVRWKRDRVKVTQRLREKRRADKSFAMLHTIRCRLASLIGDAKAKTGKSTGKSARTLELLGCSVTDLMIYLESKFESGMTWANHGVGASKWQIDHIMPCAIFDLTRPDHQRRCFHFSNLQPMWASENARKNDGFHPAQVEVAKSWLST